MSSPLIFSVASLSESASRTSSLSPYPTALRTNVKSFLAHASLGRLIVSFALRATSRLCCRQRAVVKPDDYHARLRKSPLRQIWRKPVGVGEEMKCASSSTDMILESTSTPPNFVFKPSDITPGSYIHSPDDQPIHLPTRKKA